MDVETYAFVNGNLSLHRKGNCRERSGGDGAEVREKGPSRWYVCPTSCHQWAKRPPKRELYTQWTIGTPITKSWKIYSSIQLFEVNYLKLSIIIQWLVIAGFKILNSTKKYSSRVLVSVKFLMTSSWHLHLRGLI